MNLKLTSRVCSTFFCAMAALCLQTVRAETPAEDPYEEYIKTSKDFKWVHQDKKFLEKSLPSWTVMPWYAAWPVGYDDDSGKWCVEHGINGSFIDRGNANYLSWIDKFNLRFYADHTAGKGDLHLWDGGPGGNKPKVCGTGIRVKPMNDKMLEQLKGVVKAAIERMKGSPNRGAYALDDEISWGSFIHPCMWQATDDAGAYKKWLDEIYGKGNAPARQGWIGYNDILPKLRSWDVGSFDASHLMDQWSFNDSYFNNFIGDLVEYANSLDPETPCGYVGGQMPNAFGGFDYVKGMRKIQFIESYGAREYTSSFNPLGVFAATLFFNNVQDGIWQSWSQCASGNRSMIIWWDGAWWDGKKAKPFVDEFAPTWKELTQKIGPLLTGAQRSHDGVALYYNHASVQLSWIMDAESHGKTWTNRSSSADGGLSCSALGRRAWMNMVHDEELEFNWLGYADLIEKGVPPEIKVLILPSTLCLSDAEAKKIREFCNKGGTVIADYLPGLWDQHGKGRASGALDDVFGVKHDPKLKSADVFGGNLWVETNQDANFGAPPEKQLTNANNCIKDASGYNKAVRNMEVSHVNKFGKGSAVLLNLSPLWYNVYRSKGMAEAAKRDVFTKYIGQAGVKPRVSIKDSTAQTFGHEFLWWTKGDRTLVFLIANPETSFSALGGGNSAGLKAEAQKITIAFANAISKVKDERSGKDLEDGKEFTVDWKMNEGVVLSFATPK